MKNVRKLQTLAVQGNGKTVHVRVDVSIVCSLAGVEQATKMKQAEIVSWVHRWLASVLKQSEAIPEAKNS